MKKYRWNKKKCFRNIASLLIRIVVVTIVLIMLGAGPSVESMGIDTTPKDECSKQLMMYKEKPDRDLTLYKHANMYK